MLRRPAFHRDIPLGTIVAEIASHSGILCSASAIAINIPNASLGPNDTHIATHSENECKVITHSISNALLASAHESISIESESYFCSLDSDRRIKYSHANTPKATHNTTNGTPKYDSVIFRLVPCCTTSRLHNASYISPKLAAIMSDAAIALSLPMVLVERSRTKAKGNAPSQVHNAVISA